MQRATIIGIAVLIAIIGVLCRTNYKQELSITKLEAQKVLDKIAIDTSNLINERLNTMLDGEREAARIAAEDRNRYKEIAEQRESAVEQIIIKEPAESCVSQPLPNSYIKLLSDYEP